MKSLLNILKSLNNLTIRGEEDLTFNFMILNKLFYRGSFKPNGISKKKEEICQI